MENTTPLLKEHEIYIYGANSDDLIKNVTNWLHPRQNKIRITGKQFIGPTNRGWAVRFLYCNRNPEDIKDET